MKKVILAGILAATVAGAVQAQSTVAVYGVIDTAVQSYNSGTATFTRSADNLLSTSRLGFKGTEDLGGGLKANFMLESQVNPAGGSLGSTTVATNEIFNREAWVGISGGFGEIRVGRQDVTYAQDIDSGVSGIGNFATRPINGTAVELGSDQKNVVKYITPKVAGFTVQVGHASGNAAGATTNAQASQTGAHVKYEIGKFVAHAGYQKNDGTTTAAQRDFTVVGAGYDFGFVSTGVSYAEGDVSTTGDVKSKSTVVNVKVPLTNGLALHGVYAMANDGAQSSANDGQGYTVAVTKALSKRTTIYTAYTVVNNEANSAMYMTGTTAPASTGLDTKAFTLGLSHTF